MDNYHISGNKLIFEEGHVVEFDFPVLKTLIINQSIIILLNVPGKKGYNQNIFAVNFRGKIIWQIERSADLDGIGDCPFVSVEINKSELVCFAWCGFRLTVNPASGKVTSQIFAK